MKKWYQWKRIAAAAVTGALLLQIAGCGSTQKTGDAAGASAGSDVSGTGDGSAQGESGAGGESGDSRVSDTDWEEPAGNGRTATYEQEELDASWDELDATIVTCSGTKAQIDGAGATAEEGRIRITSGGTYILRGDYQGQVCVDAGKKDEVRLVFDQFAIECLDSSPIYGLQSGRIILTLAEGTENRVSDGDTYVYASADEDEPDAAIFSKDDLTINGSGKLEVFGNYSDGIRSKDDLKIVSGEIWVTAVKDGIKGKDSVSIRDGKIRVESGEDGILSNNDQDVDKGYVIVDGGDIQIAVGDDGIHAETWLTIHGGRIRIDESYEGLEGMKVDINGGEIWVTSSDDGINGAGEGTVSDQETYIRITGGEITVDSGADGFDSNGNVYVHGGAVYINGPVGRGDGALDYDGRALISGGTFAAVGSAEMMQVFSEASTQRMLMVYYGQSQAGGTAVSLRTKEGEESFSWNPTKAFACILLSLPELEEGETYTLRTGEETQEITVDGILTQIGESADGPGGRGGAGRNGGPGRGGEAGGPGRGGAPGDPGREGAEGPGSPGDREGAERPELPEGGGERPGPPEGRDGGERLEPPEGGGERPGAPDGRGRGGRPGAPEGGGEGPGSPEDQDETG